MRIINTGISAVLASCVLAFLLISPAFAEEAVNLKAEESKPAAQAIFRDEQGLMHPLNPQKNALTILHFWATWCVPCVKELPEVDATAAAYGDKGLRIVALSMDGDNNLPKARKFLADHNITHLTLYGDFGQSSFKAAEIKGLPTSIFIDSDGKEIARAEGPIDWKSKEVTSFLESHLK